jgi:hypothetical protein
MAANMAFWHPVGMTRILSKLSAVFLLAASLAGQSASDDFDRANASTLGPDWSVVEGAFGIDANQAKKDNPWSFGFVFHTGLAGDYALSSQQVDFGSGGGNLSLIAGLDPNTWSAVEARLQDNDGDGAMDRLFFNSAVNAGNWNGSSLWYDLATPTVTGTMKLSFVNNGDIALVEITNSAGGSESFQAGGILSSSFPPAGDKLAVGGFGTGTFDNWSGSIEPYSIANLAAGRTATMQLAGMQPGRTAIFAYSRTGPGPTLTNFGWVNMSLPIRTVGGGIAGADGVARFDVAVPAIAAGLTIYSQALNVTTTELSNSVVMVVQ